MKVYVVTHVFQGVLNDVRVFLKEADADKYEKKLCEDNKVPYDREKRHNEYDGDDDIQQWIVEAE